MNLLLVWLSFDIKLLKKNLNVIVLCFFMSDNTFVLDVIFFNFSCLPLQNIFSVWRKGVAALQGAFSVLRKHVVSLLEAFSILRMLLAALQEAFSILRKLLAALFSPFSALRRVIADFYFMIF